MVTFVIERFDRGTFSREEINAPILQIGRAATAELRSDDPTVSLEHAVIETDGEGYWIVDRGSLTGTYVAMKPVDRARLQRGDRVDIGDLRLEVRETEPLLLLRCAASPHVATEISTPAIDYRRSLSLGRPYLSVAIVAAIAVFITLALFASVIATRNRRAFVPGGLSSAHERVRVLDRCDRCHEPFRRVSSGSCEACHRQRRHTNEISIAEPECASCHPEHRGQKVLAGVAARQCTSGCHRNASFGMSHPQFSAVSIAPFDHAVHRESACDACHQLALDGRFRLIRTSCGSCHDSVVAVPPMPAKLFQSAEFNHAKHSEIACAKCHDAVDAIRLPSRDVCVECHGARDGVRASACVTCHRYHMREGNRT